MILLAIRRAVRCPSCVTPLLCLTILFCAVGVTFAAVVGDHVELNATHQAGIPFHQEPCGTHDFQRVPDGTKATVREVAPAGSPRATSAARAPALHQLVLLLRGRNPSISRKGTSSASPKAIRSP
jgi:hypothetical protein